MTNATPLSTIALHAARMAAGPLGATSFQEKQNAPRFGAAAARLPLPNGGAVDVMFEAFQGGKVAYYLQDVPRNCRRPGERIELDAAALGGGATIRLPYREHVIGNRYDQGFQDCSVHANAHDGTWLNQATLKCIRRDLTADVTLLRERAMMEALAENLAEQVYEKLSEKSGDVQPCRLPELVEGGWRWSDRNGSYKIRMTAGNNSPDGFAAFWMLISVFEKQDVIATFHTDESLTHEFESTGQYRLPDTSPASVLQLVKGAEEAGAEVLRCALSWKENEAEDEEETVEP